jgi:hypothetical protein
LLALKSPAREPAACSEEAGSTSVGPNAAALTDEEADLLAPPTLVAHAPWLLPLIVRRTATTADIDADNEVEPARQD